MMLADIVGGTENSTANQNAQVLTQVAQYFGSLATFINDSNVTINETVSVQ
jgi:class 3 adenylate cyclase